MGVDMKDLLLKILIRLGGSGAIALALSLILSPGSGERFRRDMAYAILPTGLSAIVLEAIFVSPKKRDPSEIESPKNVPGQEVSANPSAFDTTELELESPFNVAVTTPEDARAYCLARLLQVDSSSPTAYQETQQILDLAQQFGISLQMEPVLQQTDPVDPVAEQAMKLNNLYRAASEHSSVPVYQAGTEGEEQLSQTDSQEDFATYPGNFFCV